MESAATPHLERHIVAPILKVFALIHVLTTPTPGVPGRHTSMERMWRWAPTNEPLRSGKSTEEMMIPPRVPKGIIH